MQFTLRALLGALAVTSVAALEAAYTPNADDQPWPETAQGGFDAFVIQQARPHVIARMDPIVDPGKVAGHVHAIVGASNFRNVPNTPQEAQEAECTSLLFQADKSNYWYPELYYIRDDGRFEALQTGVKMYYFGKGYNIQPFPQGMRIVVGTATSRAKDFRQSYEWNCQYPDQKRVGTGGFIPNGTQFPDGCANPMLTIDYPCCGWANGSLDSWDHFSHLTFPIYQGSWTEYHSFADPVCPPTHPIRYPNIRMEAFWTMTEGQKWRTSGPNFALSNGDTVGSTAHADYISNWDMDVQRQAISQCTFGRGPGDSTSERCVPLQGSINETMAQNCRYAGKIPSEDVGLHDPIDHLPGCNPLWPAEAGDKKPTDCPWYTGDPGWTAPNVYWIGRKPNYNPLPDALLLPPGDTNMTRANIAKYNGTVYKGENTGTFYGQQGYFAGWGEYLSDEIMNWTEMFKWSNQVLVGTNQEVWDNRFGCNATDKSGTGATAGMIDSSRFSGVTPACKVDPSLYQSNPKKLGGPKANPLAPGPIHPACGAVAKHAMTFPTKGFLPGPAVEIKDTPNGNDPYEHNYSFYAAGYWPSHDNGAPQWDSKSGTWLEAASSTVSFAAIEENPAPGFNGTLLFSPPKAALLSCGNGVAASVPVPVPASSASASANGSASSSGSASASGSASGSDSPASDASVSASASGSSIPGGQLLASATSSKGPNYSMLPDFVPQAPPKAGGQLIADTTSSAAPVATTPADEGVVIIAPKPADPTGSSDAAAPTVAPPSASASAAASASASASDSGSAGPGPQTSGSPASATGASVSGTRKKCKRRRSRRASP